MRKTHLTLIALGALTLGLLAAGCGGDDETGATDATTAATTTTTAATTTTTGDASVEGASSEDVYNACIDAIEGTAAEQIGQTACEQARDAFEQCAKEAEQAGGDAAETALGICQQAADQAVKSLQASAGG
ncbi:MAG: hypothetical protein KJ006_03660 [Thermoleophilia bacterium]|nr:hypothetical protein [Thermoleophilia bacterium]GIK78147.1 MAG: hypothetical protein BroJett022_18370 [Actinomycetes bacterium]